MIKEWARWLNSWCYIIEFGAVMYGGVPVMPPIPYSIRFYHRYDKRWPR